ncbi:hypothetical protein KVT40_004112 [Elsinoe batatas]|uniref:Uncharacterized protein n=1 Tax=Elsinoe batatas TaxID=2601811 RepID=A0A8K0L4D0_9PEZI|nr:hypothetical protein KVT40_004112 [Elsinoe batatas]
MVAHPSGEQTPTPGLPRSQHCFGDNRADSAKNGESSTISQEQGSVLAVARPRPDTSTSTIPAQTESLIMLKEILDAQNRLEYRTFGYTTRSELAPNGRLEIKRLWQCNPLRTERLLIAWYDPIGQHEPHLIDSNIKLRIGLDRLQRAIARQDPDAPIKLFLASSEDLFKRVPLIVRGPCTRVPELGNQL